MYVLFDIKELKFLHVHSSPIVLGHLAWVEYPESSVWVEPIDGYRFLFNFSLKQLEQLYFNTIGAVTVGDYTVLQMLNVVRELVTRLQPTTATEAEARYQAEYANGHIRPKYGFQFQPGSYIPKTGKKPVQWLKTVPNVTEKQIALSQIKTSHFITTATCKPANEGLQYPRSQVIAPQIIPPWSSTIMANKKPNKPAPAETGTVQPAGETVETTAETAAKAKQAEDNKAAAAKIKADAKLQKAQEREVAKAKAKEAKAANKQPEQNGIRRPKPGTKTGQVWDLADGLSKDTGAPAARKAILEAGEKAGINKDTVMTQFSAWRKFYGISGRSESAPAEKAAA